ncbi:MAG TPA: cysteine hydrolase family protein [Gemmatimonadales bacterium]|nr:cysteine hydrolase family protein [Gemmatimonadales bacterium]
MGSRIFWDVDTQADFMHPTGKLYVPGSEEIIPVLERLTRYAHAGGIRIVASADDHVPGHRELAAAPLPPDWRETFPEHCMRGTPGQRKIAETTLRNPLLIEPEPQDPGQLARRVRDHDGDILFHKHWFDVFTNPNVLPVVDELAPAEIVLYGVALDVCDKYAVEGLLRHRPRIPVTLVTDAVRSIDPEAGSALLEDWRRRGVRLASSAEVMAG